MEITNKKTCPRCPKCGNLNVIDTGNRQGIPCDKKADKPMSEPTLIYYECENCGHVFNEVELKE